MAVCGDVRTQYCIMETLLRWLLPRQDPTVRRDACTKWFPLTLYNNDAVDIFMKKPWLNFFKVKRVFFSLFYEPLYVYYISIKLYIIYLWQDLFRFLLDF